MFRPPRIPSLFALACGLFGLRQALFGHLRIGDGLTGGLSVAVALALFAVSSGKLSRPGSALQSGLALARGAGSLALLAVASLGFHFTFFRNVLVGQGGLFGGSLPEGANDGLLNASGTIALTNVVLLLLAAGALGAILAAFGERGRSCGEDSFHV
ncbi:sodium:proton antiporter [Aminithiophilus ramosus]|uniref:Sodium:proton antiporter n=2 Tax=Synergistales TaxID=649776 RepID=A0A9Q7ETY4_9BACT|nr:sodium:proton antiporter [Aminithiophilus ramosus]QTX31328.1 sodium:proton antiporter [Aminithiophilus ramosus]